MSDKFYTLWCPTFPTPPKKTYDSSEQAHAVAKSMATKQPGDEFHVMECVATYKAEKPVEPKLVVEQRNETKKERETREANLERECQALAAMASKPAPYIPNQAINLVAKYPAPQNNTGRTGPLAPGEESLDRARKLIGKRVSIADMSGLLTNLMDSNFRNQIDIEHRANCTPATWAGRYPQTGDAGVVIAAGDRRPQSAFYSSTWTAVQSVKYTSDNDIALVVRLDKGISVTITMPSVKPEPDVAVLPLKVSELVEGNYYLLKDGVKVRAWRGTNRVLGREEVRGHRSVLVNTDAQLSNRAYKSSMCVDNVGSSTGWYLVEA
jgi:hypothetical protein